MEKTIRVECSNWAYFVNLDPTDYEKELDMAVEAMTRSIEDYSSKNFDNFLNEEDEFSLSPYIFAFVESSEEVENEYVTEIEFILGNAGFYSIANELKQIKKTAEEE